MGARDQVRIIITAPKRVKDSPEVPTLKEQGYDVQFVNGEVSSLLRVCQVQKLRRSKKC